MNWYNYIISLFKKANIMSSINSITPPDNNPIVNPLISTVKIPLVENAPFLLAMVITIGLFVIFGIMVFHPLAQENHDVITSIISIVLTVWVTACGYFFGTSASSKSKDTTISNLLTAKPTVSNIPTTITPNTTTTVVTNTPTTNSTVQS
jgi:hypothetical protein